MPKIVNHEARREELVEATWRVIARAGMVGATMREIAREAGVSTGILAHYFTDKEDLLGFALRLSHRRIYERDVGRPGLRDAGRLAQLGRAADLVAPLDT